MERLQGIPLLINDHIYVEIEMPLWFVVFDKFYDVSIGCILQSMKLQLKSFPTLNSRRIYSARDLHVNQLTNSILLYNL